MAITTIITIAEGLNGGGSGDVNHYAIRSESADVIDADVADFLVDLARAFTDSIRLRDSERPAESVKKAAQLAEHLGYKESVGVWEGERNIALPKERSSETSSSVRRIRWDEETLTATVTFTNGAKYRYTNVSEMEWELILTAQSLGTAVNQMLKQAGKPYERVGQEDG